MRALLGKLHRSENCPERKVEVFIGLWVTVSLLISFRSQKPGFLAPITDRLEAGGARGQGEMFTGSTISEGQLCPPSAPVWHPLQPHVTAHLQDEIAAQVSSQFFFSHPNLTTFPSLSFILGIKKIQIAMHLSAVVPSSQLMDRSMWYHVRSAALTLCLGSDFLQSIRVHTTQISDNIKVYILP